MPSLPITSASAFALASALMLLSNGAVLADHAPKPATEAAHSHDHDHDHTHEHDHAHDHAHDEASKKVSQGYFDDSAIQDRPLSDWSGAWQSVYPYLKDGTLQPVMAKKPKAVRNPRPNIRPITRRAIAPRSMRSPLTATR